MVIVEAFTNGTQSDQWVLPRADVLVIGSVSIHVGSTVDQPGDIERDGIAEDGGQEVGIPQTLSPDAPGHQCGDHEAHEHHGDLIVLSLEPDHRISQQVSEVKLSPLLDDISMLANK